MPHRAGLRVKALIEEKTVATEMVMAKGRYNRPVIPGMTMVGTKTASSTRVVATTGPVISIMDLAVASLASSPSVSMIRRVFSTTTMASSTTMPITRMRPNMVSC